MLKAIIFDFDGVLCESVEAKTEAFRKVFLDYPEHLDAIIAYHMKHGGISRYKKFEYIFQYILKKPITDEILENLASTFKGFAYAEVVSAPLVQGTEVFLKKYAHRFQLFIASGTPEDEMVKIVHEKKIEDYFTGVFGSPKTKYEIAALVLERYHIAPQEAVFVGDAISDFEGASQANIRFIGRLHEKYDNPFKNEKVFHYIRNLDDLDKFMVKLI